MESWSAPEVPTVPGEAVELRLHDTATGAARPVRPGPVAGMYVCGITPYDTTHLGHAATYLAFDLINRVLRDGGHRVHYVQNVTDVDDPLFERAERDGVDWRELGTAEIERFRADMEALRILPPSDYVAATETVDEVVEMVTELLARGMAYRLDEAVDGYADIYYPVLADPHFGYESGYDRETMSALFAERGGDPERPGKRDPLDALLWRIRRPGEPAWPSPWGAGRPGWHVECSAIARNRLGPCFDIQGGGSDLVFPHHEFSAAHAESARDDGRFARFYVHTGMIGLDGVKMSKSLGNLVRVRELRESGVDPVLVRLGLLAGHYRADRSWSEEVLHEAEARRRRWLGALDSVAASDPGRTGVPELERALRERLADDLDTPGALAAVDDWCGRVPADRSPRDGADPVEPSAADRVRRALDALLGLEL